MIKEMSFLMLIFWLVMGSSVAYAEDSYSFKDLKLGAAKEDLNLKQFRCAENKGPLADESCYAIKDVTIAGQPAESVALFFINNTLSMINVVVKEQYFSKVESAMAVKYGDPSSQTVKAVKNRMGVSFDNKTVTWTNSTSTIRAEQRASKVTESNIRYMLNTYTKDFAEREKSLSKSAASDL
jgi:hypothetical protein